MDDAGIGRTGIGRVLTAALHQGIADLLPTRLDFYENWFDIAGPRHGSMGLAPLNAVLSFLRREGEAYTLVTGRAGAYAGEWTVQELPRLRRGLIRAMPPSARARLALGVAGHLVQSTYPASRALVRVRRDQAAVEIRSSIFCGIRERSAVPLCGFYAAAFREVLARLDSPAAAEVAACRGTGHTGCRLVVTLGRSATLDGVPAVELASTSE